MNLALKGRNMTGTLGEGPTRYESCSIVAPLQGANGLFWPVPRALPWAVALRRFAASTGPVEVVRKIQSQCLG